MYSSDLYKIILKILKIASITTFCHIFFYNLLQTYYLDSTRAITVTFIICVTVIATYLVIFPFTKFPTNNKLTEEEK